MELKLFEKDCWCLPISNSNRTFMELKFNKVRVAAVIIADSNRTFMELKYVIGIVIRTNIKTPIAPLWN